MSSCYEINLGWAGICFLILWLGGNAVIFSLTFLSFIWKDELSYLYSMLGYPINFSKGAADALNFNCALVLLPVCKNIISFLRGCLKCCRPNAVRRQLDNNIIFHKLVGYTICFWTAIHYIGHSFILERFIDANKSKYGLLYKLTELSYNKSLSWINPIKSNNTFPIYELVIMLPGWSGLGATITLIIMVASSTEVIRRKFHEVFWYTHHLFVLFFIFIIIHGFGGVVRSQINNYEHDPKLCSNDTYEWGTTDDCPMPQFRSQIPRTWAWVTGGLILYGIETIIKLINRFMKVEIVEACIHPSDVLELKMKKGGFKSNSGQYITIMCPSLSYFQWHPFTLTSTPEDDFFSIHIQIQGNWTKALYKKFKDGIDNSQTEKMISFPRISVDGPFGTCCEDIHHYDTVMLVGGGIGVTPYISVLKHIWHLHKNGQKMKIKKIYFYWICRDGAFKWFVELLKQVEKEMEEAGDEFVSIKIFWSKGWDYEIHKKILQNECDKDAVTDLKSRTYFGRPNWSHLFSEVRDTHSDKEIGVFCCGSKSFSKCIKVQCINNTNVLPLTKSRFIFHKENF